MFALAPPRNPSSQGNRAELQRTVRDLLLPLAKHRVCLLAPFARRGQAFHFAPLTSQPRCTLLAHVLVGTWWHLVAPGGT